MCSSDSVEVKGLLSLQFASLYEEFVVVPANVVLKCTRCKLSSRRALISSFTRFSRLLDKGRLSQDSVKRFCRVYPPVDTYCTELCVRDATVVASWQNARDGCWDCLNWIMSLLIASGATWYLVCTIASLFAFVFHFSFFIIVLPFIVSKALLR